MFRNRDYYRIQNSLLIVYKSLFKGKTESLRQFLLESPTQYTDVFKHFDLTRINLRLRKKNQMIGLAIISWYFPEEIRFLVQEELREIWDPESKEVMEILLNSQDFAVAWLICSSDWTESDFFGNVLNKDLAFLWSLSNFRKISRRKVKKYSGYCRGYQESNRGAPSPFLPKELFAKSDVESEIQKELRYQEKLRNLQLKVEQDLNLLLLEGLFANL